MPRTPRQVVALWLILYESNAYTDLCTDLSSLSFCFKSGIIKEW